MKNRKLIPNYIGLAILATISCAHAEVSSDLSLRALEAGNTRYVAGESTHPRIDPERRRATALEGQTPLAAILGCADSRVPPEIVFDQGFADLFVVRVAGNVCAMPELASIEYAVVALKVPLIVVMGHTKCGAVDAAIKNKPLPGSLPQLIELIRPAVQEAEKQKSSSDDLLARATERNVVKSIDELKKSPVIKAAIDAKQLKIVGAIRHIKDGNVTWLK